MSSLNTIYTNLIINPQRNANCTVQASQLNGGNLAQFLNTQAMRTIKGYVNLNTGTGTVDCVVYNEYQQDPLTLGPSDVIVAAVVENASGSSVGSYVVPLVGGTCRFYTAAPPSNSSNAWVSGALSTPLSASLNTTQLNTGVNLTLTITSSDVNGDYYLSCSSDVFTSPNPSLIITLLILNSSHAQ
jgi:hypothetical protein